MLKPVLFLLCDLLLVLPSLASAGQLGQGTGSSYPSTLDTKTTFTDKVSCDTTITTRICSATPNDLQAAIVNIETELGLLPKGSFASVVARLNAGVYIGTAGASLAAAAGGLVYSTSTTLAVQSAGTSGYFARSGGTGAPTWFDLFSTANTFTATQTLSFITPSFIMTDTTALAKSLTVAVGSNIANFRESAGASGSLLALDLANNRVGIGTAAPSNKLTIDTASAVVNIAEASRHFIIRSTDAVAADLGPQMSFSGSSGGATTPYAFATIAGRKEGAVAFAGYLQFATTAGTSGVINERMRIDSTGNVGIGTTNPNVGLEMGSTLNVRIPNIKSTTGVRYVCVDVNGTLTSQAAACSGT